MREKKSSLRGKTILFSGGILVLLVVVLGGLESDQLIRTFTSLQRSLLEEQIQRFTGHLKNISRTDELLFREYAEWDDAYHFFKGSNPRFITQYFDPESTTITSDVAFFFDTQKTLFATCELKQTPSLERGFSKANVRRVIDSDLLAEDRVRFGLIVQNSKIMLLTVGPVMQTNLEGPSAGWFMLGRWVDKQTLSAAFELVGMSISKVEVVSSTEAKDTQPKMLGESISGVMTWVSVLPMGDSNYVARVFLPTLNPEEMVEIEVQIPMKILEAVKTARTSIFILGAIGGLCLILLPLIAFEWIVLRRLTDLDRRIQQMAEGKIEGPIEVNGNDEISRLSESINRLMSSERKIMEQFRMAEHDAKAIFEAIADPVFVFGYESDGKPGTYRYVSQGACAFLGYSQEELLKLSPAQVEEREMEGSTQSKQQQESKRSAILETHLITSDGDRIPVEMHAIHAEVSARLVCVAVARSLVARRVIDNQMREAKEAAEAASRAKDDFLATMSHEIRTPLHGVIGFAELLRTSDLPPEMLETVESIHDSAQILQRLVTDVLDFSRIEAGQLSLQESPTDLKEVLRRICASTRLLAKEKGLEFEYREDPRLPIRVRADSLRIEQVLGNLLSNALKFTERGKIELESRMVSVSKGERLKIEFVVSDSGIGMGAGDATRLFQPFSQLDSSYSRRFGGSGLGLAIVKRLCELMGGEVRMTSVLRKGSVFSASIRVGELTNSPDHTDSDTSNSSDWNDEPLSILVIEDNRLNQKLIRRLLQNRGHQIEIAEDGPSGVKRVFEAEFDLILMDVSMPGLNGLDAVKLIREEETQQGRKRNFIVALTAGVSEAERQACSEAGMDEFLGKPFQPDKLFGILHKAHILRTGSTHTSCTDDDDQKAGTDEA